MLLVAVPVAVGHLQRLKDPVDPDGLAHRLFRCDPLLEILGTVEGGGKALKIRAADHKKLSHELMGGVGRD
jgi:hypothetical protein